ncbi:recombination regulator RecX [Agrilactobacillus composti DSM 18527 = JCM 14202]|uniref:Regulatory protein RecX n=1 Tax=Agrilactobacillus composti DSM 18527 = JCM 14202 TaxID=1423734 RepID=A0A0R1XMG6_9LACO|nr:recombination regulator RecX [Agrilactobacillus composti]KRM31463.1 recombination regulator RecX [Agrilactobacillus composti DSM 18527 = JCM 14202]
MKITKIEVQKHHKDRYSIYLDDEYAFPVAESVLIQFVLAKGQELTEAEVTKIKNADNNAKAYSRALDYLSHQLRSVKEVKNDLYDKDYSTPVIQNVIAKLKTLNYLDDENFTRSLIRTDIRIAKKGPRTIAGKLRQKGIDAPMIDMAMADEYPLETQVDNALAWVEKLSQHTGGKSFFALQQKIKQNLLQKGFDMDVIKAALDAADLQKDSRDEQDALTKAGDKLWRRYATLPQGKQKIKQTLYRKGFAIDDIQHYLDEKAEADA